MVSYQQLYFVAKMFTIEMVPIRYSIGLMVKNKYRMSKNERERNCFREHTLENCVQESGIETVRKRVSE